MEKERNKIIDAILKFMLENDYKFNTKLNDKSNFKPSFERNLFWSEWKLLVSENKLIRKFENSDYVFILTDEGRKAAEFGVEKYLEEIENDKQLDRDVKTSSIKSSRLSKWAIGISIVAVISSFIVPFLVVNYEQHIKNPENINSTRQQRQIETDKSQSVQLTDSALIENSLKHDTLIINNSKK